LDLFLAAKTRSPDNDGRKSRHQDECVTARSTPTAAQLLESATAGDRQALDALMPIVYDELRRLAARYLARERPGQTIQATALVHEAYLRLFRDKGLHWQNRPHFLAIAAQSMRHILVERARARRSYKRGGDRERITLEAELAGTPAQSLDIIALDQALERLAALDQQHARIVELRFFAGLTVEETADMIGVSPATVKRDWAIARAWLYREMNRQVSG
jgi:RNA polymerase sigma-70 factor, ECF subfamily